MKKDISAVLVAAKASLRLLPVIAAAAFLSACGSSSPGVTASAAGETRSQEYRIGPGDQLEIFVWRNPEVSVEVPVRPEGRISTPLVEDMMAAGKTPTQLARDLEEELAEFIREPVVTVIVTDFTGNFGDQIRIVGEAANPQALSYRNNMTVLDVMIEVGGLTEYAAGNRAKIIRRAGDEEEEIPVRLENLLQRGDISANVRMLPGDILIIPETWF